MRFALAQINTSVGDLEGNARLVEARVAEALARDVRVIAFPELTVSGYPPEDLLLKPAFLRDCRAALERIAGCCRAIMAFVGFPEATPEGTHNAAALLGDGRILDIYAKGTLPNYGVFDEKRYFRPGVRCPVYDIDGCRIGINICEDSWAPAGIPAVQVGAGKANILLNLSSSPYHTGKGKLREDLLRYRARQYGVWMLYVNLVGGQDELVFDGRSLAVAPDGTVVAQAVAFREELLVLDVDPKMDKTGGGGAGADRGKAESFAEPFSEGLEYLEEHLYPELVEIRVPIATGTRPAQTASGLPVASRTRPCPGPLMTEEEEIYEALVLGARDYVRKNGFRGVIVGLSGGIDSALTAAIATDALGPQAVRGISMPSSFTSELSRRLARDGATRLGFRFSEIPIDGLVAAYARALEPTLGSGDWGVAAENIQARIRGNILMALSNRYGELVLTTGNKSEVAVGYCTLYGDTAGGFAVLRDAFKTLVYRLARYRNARTPNRPPIPEEILTRPPSAELKPDQRDTDSLPPYEILDPILQGLIEEDRDPRELATAGFDASLAAHISRLVDRNEYKRRQAPPGIKLTPRAFGKDRRYPITNRYLATDRLHPSKEDRE